jgi:two-component system chemotaxis response regulator CheB
VKVLVVDDSAFMRKAISQMIASDPAFEVVDTARNGKEAVEKAKALAPDLITLDIEMPEMDGLAALRKIRIECPDPRPAVLMCSSLTVEGSHEALKALRLGAADVIAKSHSTFAVDIHDMRGELLAKLHAIGQTRQRRTSRASTPAAGQASVTRTLSGAESALPRTLDLASRTLDLIVIGSSTGGPPVLETLLTRLPADLRPAVVVAQHMPVLFTRSISERLAQQCKVQVIHGDKDMPVMPGCVYIIAGGKHGHLVKAPAGTAGGAKFALSVRDEPTSEPYKPSANVLFSTAAKLAGKHTLGVMLTGMGEDGKNGAVDLRDAGGVTAVQDADTCVVYGMPRAVVEAGAAHAMMTPDELGQMLSTLGGRARSALPPPARAGGSPVPGISADRRG